MKSRQTHGGSRIIRPIRLGGWRLLEVPHAAPRTLHETCPALCGTLLTLATVTSGDGETRISVGVCPVCGYAGYTDPPSREWMDEFYASGMWDYGGRGPRKFDGNTSSTLLLGLGLPRDASVLDVGCGYGELLNFLRARGYSKLTGIESSPQRAKGAARDLGLDVLEGSFGEKAIGDALGEKAPFDVVVCHHVLEHSYDPAEMLRGFANFQREGGQLILSVPNGIKEPAATTLLFLPHLHSFTVENLDRLLFQAGYGMKSVKDDGRVITLRAERGATAARTKTQDLARDYTERYLTKLIRIFALPEGAGEHILWWHRKIDAGGFRAVGKTSVRSRLSDAMKSYWLRAKLAWRGIPRARAEERFELLARGLTMRHTSVSKSPLEIQWEGELMLLYK